MYIAFLIKTLQTKCLSKHRILLQRWILANRICVKQKLPFLFQLAIFTNCLTTNRKTSFYIKVLFLNLLKLLTSHLAYYLMSYLSSQAIIADHKLPLPVFSEWLWRGLQHEKTMNAITYIDVHYCRYCMNRWTVFYILLFFILYLFYLIHWGTTRAWNSFKEWNKDF